MIVQSNCLCTYVIPQRDFQEFQRKRVLARWDRAANAARQWRYQRERAGTFDPEEWARRYPTVVGRRRPAPIEDGPRLHPPYVRVDWPRLDHIDRYLLAAEREFRAGRSVGPWARLRLIQSQLPEDWTR